MAYVSQEKKAKIKTALDKVMPKGWKWSLAVRHHSTIVLTISKGPRDLTICPAYSSPSEDYPERQKFDRSLTGIGIDKSFPAGKTLETMKKVVDALNTDNFDKSDSQTDYFHVGHYVDIRIGRYDKPFVVTK